MNSMSALDDAWNEYESVSRPAEGNIQGPTEAPVADCDVKTPATVSVEDFFAYMPLHQYLFIPTRELWPGASVNARCAAPTNTDGTRATKRVQRKGRNGTVEWQDVPLTAAEWLDQNRPIEMMTWAPGQPMVMRDRLVSNGGLIDRSGCAVFNLYQPPEVERGDPTAAGPWIEHVQTVYGPSADHIICWLAHRVQRPGEKINHSLVLGGAQGIGKDTILEPVKYAVGPWNFTEVGPSHVLGRFNGFAKSVVLRVSEARDLGDVGRIGFYEHMKVYAAAPPDVLRCDEKNIREHAVMNVCGVIITTNHKTDGIYLPPDDRRHYVAWSELTRDAFGPEYWNELYRWYAQGGMRHVAAYLAAFDLSGFDPKAPPPKTAAFWDIVDANRAPEDAELAHALEAIKNPEAVALIDIAVFASEPFRNWLQDRKNRRHIPHRLESVGYVPVRNQGSKDGLWVIDGRRQSVYVRGEMSSRDRYAAANRCARGERGRPSTKSVKSVIDPLR